MPYEIRKSGDQYCVHKKSDGKKMGCHESRNKAARQIAAIEANESSARLADINQTMLNDRKEFDTSLSMAGMHKNKKKKKKSYAQSGYHAHPMGEMVVVHTHPYESIKHTHPELGPGMEIVVESPEEEHIE